MSSLTPSFRFIAQERHLRRQYEQAEAIRQLENRAGRGSLREFKTDSDAESSADEYEDRHRELETDSDAESSEDKYEDRDSDSDNSVQYQYDNEDQLADLPADLPTAEATSGVSSHSTSNKEASSHADLSSAGNNPPSPWGNSKAKQRIIDELKDDKSDIHLLIGSYNATSFSNVNFVRILEKYAHNRYKMSNFRENLKRLLKHYLGKTGPFKVEGVEPWYTSTKNVSRAYSLLFMLYMDKKKSSKISGMSVEEIWASHPQFQLYELDKFKTYNKNMETLTSRRKRLVSEEEAIFRRDMIKLKDIISDKTSRGYPFWHTHPASKLLKDDIAREMSGNMNKRKPTQLWESRVQYQDFPLSVFRKHIYQERTKQLAAPYWQHTRNKIAQKKYEEAECMVEEWDAVQANRDMKGLIMDWERLHLD